MSPALSSSRSLAVRREPERVGAELHRAYPSPLAWTSAPAAPSSDATRFRTTARTVFFLRRPVSAASSTLVTSLPSEPVAHHPHPRLHAGPVVMIEVGARARPRPAGSRRAWMPAAERSSGPPIPPGEARAEDTRSPRKPPPPTPPRRGRGSRSPLSPSPPRGGGWGGGGVGFRGPPRRAAMTEFRPLRGTDLYSPPTTPSKPRSTARASRSACSSSRASRARGGCSSREVIAAGLGALEPGAAERASEHHPGAGDGLYVYDTVQRLHDSRFGDGDVRDIRRYIKLGPWAGRSDRPAASSCSSTRIDKADSSSRNDLLHERLDRMRLRCLEMNEQAARGTRALR